MKMEVQLKRLGPVPKIKTLKVSGDEQTKIWLAGRGTCCQIYTKSKYASRKHFVITFREKKYFISDLQSANGTFLNDEKIMSEKVLTFGCVISVGVPSKMKNEPDCIVFSFEESPNSISLEKTIILDDDDIQIIEDIPKNVVSHQITSVKNLKQEINFEKSIAQKSKKETLDCPLEAIIKKQETFTDTFLELSEDKNTEKTVLSTSINNMVNSTCEAQKRLRESEDSDCVKIMKLSETNSKQVMKVNNDCLNNENNSILSANVEKSYDSKKVDLIDEDNGAYEVLTLVEETNIKAEPNQLNYSVTEELIEISDYEDENWSSKNNELRLCEGAKEKSQNENKEDENEEEDDDDDVVFLECASSSRVKNHDVFPVLFEIEDDLTEVDKKWMDRLFKMKQELDTSSQSEKINVADIESTQTDGATHANKEPKSCNTIEDILAILDGDLTEDESMPEYTNKVAQCNVLSSSSKFTEDELQVPNLQDIENKLMPVEKETIKKSSSKKSVKFDLVPKIKYFEAPKTVKSTPIQRGESRFVRVILNICSWNTSWLEECKRVASEKDPPDLCNEPLRKIPKKFITHSDYTSAFIPVMLLNLWNKVKEHWKKYGDSTFRQTVSCDYYEDHSFENLSIFKCTGLVQSVEGHKQLIREGHLVMLRLHQVQNSKCAPQSLKYSKKLGYLVFGFIENKTYERFDTQPLHKALMERCASTHGDLHLVKLTILTKKRPSLLIDKEKLIQVTVVQSISPEMRMFRAICLLPQSPLCKAILKPSKVNFKFDAPGNKEVYFKGPLDGLQKEIVSKFTHACASSEFFMYSVHGSAGTGKGQLIVAFILELLYGSESKKNGRPKIIFCSSSNGPLDEMVKRLKHWRDNIEDSPKFSMVRVGQSKDVSPEIREFCLTNLAVNYHHSGQYSLERQKIDAEVQVLKESDVICTTCFSTGINKMVWAFEKNLANTGQKLVCILDKAMQVREPDSLLPLLLGVTHLFLIGDIYQVDSSYSREKTLRLGLDMSLFERIYKNFTNINQDIHPVYILKTQYRMNPGLSRFTTKLIYNIQLKNSTVNAFNKINHLRSYLLLVDQPPENMSETDKRSQQGQIISHLVKAINRIAQKPLNIAVITSDLNQTEALKPYLPKIKFPDVDINHFMKFQGKETDVSIFTFDSILVQSQLAIAVTRAKSCLVILTSNSSLTNNVWLQKFLDHAKTKKALVYIQSNLSPETCERILTEPFS